MKSQWITTVAALSLSFISIASEQGPVALIGPYLGQKPPGMVPKVFAPGVVSTTGAAEWGVAFTPDGWQLYFSRDTSGDPNPPYSDIYYMKAKNTVWSGPFPGPFNTESVEMEPFVTYDGKTLFFTSSRPHDGVVDGRIWGVDVRKSGWSPAWFARGPINDGFSMYLTISKKGTAAYTRMGANQDIFLATYKDGVFGDPVNVGPPINTSGGEAHPFIAIDESFIVYDTGRNGVGITCVSFRNGANSWSNPIDVAPALNMPDVGIPYVTPDRRYFFFSTNSDIYWVSSRVLKSLSPTDMACSAVSIKPGIVSRGAIVELGVKVTNRSGIYSMSTSASFYLDTSRTIGDQSIQLGSADVDSIGPHKATTLKINAVVPQDIAPGQYYLLASVDQEDWNCDPNAKNNITCRKNPITVAQQPAEPAAAARE